MEYLLKSVEKYPDKVAFRDEKTEITFSQLDNLARKIAIMLKEKTGDIKNSPIAVYMEKGVNCIVAFMGIVYSGNFYSPIDVHSPKERVSLFWKHCVLLRYWWMRHLIRVCRKNYKFQQIEFTP